MSKQSLTLCLFFGGEFIGDLEYVGGETSTYESYDVCWAYDDLDEILENFGYAKIVKVGIKANNAKTFTFLSLENNNWATYLRRAVDESKKIVSIYVQALTANELSYEKRVNEKTVTEGDWINTNVVMEGDMIIDKVVREVENYEEDDHGDAFDEEDDHDDSFDDEDDHDDALDDQDDHNDALDEEDDIEGEHECESDNESDSKYDLSDCDFSDEEDEVLEARNVIKQHKLNVYRGMKALAKNGTHQDEVEDRFVKSKVYAKNCQDKDFKFELGMKFADMKECKEAVILWNVLNGYNIRWEKSSKQRVQAECVDGCSWYLYASKSSVEPTFVITVLRDKHSCFRAKRNKQATSGWLSTQLLEVFKRNPNIEASQLKKDVKRQYDLIITTNMCYKTKKLALQKLRGSYCDDYKKLRPYVSALKRVDKEGRFELKTKLNKKGESIFQRIYIVFSALRKGFMIGCRKLIGFDGCFLKTLLGGVLLAAIGKDCNNQMYPIAWAIVEQENTESWTWFCEIVFSEFDISDGLGWSFMSDKQKGLINAVRKLTPNAEHRHCARHVFANWRLKFGGPKFRALFWAAVEACTLTRFDEALHTMKMESLQAYAEFVSRNPRSFCKSQLNSFAKTDTNKNNICETFNAWIVNSRDMPIVHLLEEIRKTVMARLHGISKKSVQYDEIVCPNILKRISKIDRQTRFCEMVPSTESMYEVSHDSHTFIVDLNGKVCSCVDWNLTGIPCCHALLCIDYERRNVVDFVDPFYYKSTWVATYKVGLQPLRGEKDWPKVEECPIMPPYITKRTGRPRKKRKRGADELQKQTSEKLTRHGVRMKCSKCGGVGHNKRKCSTPEVGNSSQVSIAPSSSAALSSSTATKDKAKQVVAPREQIRQDKRKGADGFGVYFAESRNILCRNPGSRRTQLIASSRNLIDCVQVGPGTSGQASQDMGSQVIDNSTLP